ncbi:hypothetical protein CEW46_27530 [Bacillus cereus]|nr:hypothetical protein CEW46_27530 [Bacillus cereus]
MKDNNKITVDQKKEFIKWLLNTYTFKTREINWIFNYLMSHDKLVEKVKFIDFDHRSAYRSIRYSLRTDAFELSQDNGEYITSDAEYTFNNIRMNREHDLYILLEGDCDFYRRYYEVVERNPFANKYEAPDRDRHEVAQLLQYSLFEHQKSLINKQIDEALDNQDKEKFRELSSELSEFTRYFKEFGVVKSTRPATNFS